MKKSILIFTVIFFLLFLASCNMVGGSGWGEGLLWGGRTSGEGSADATTGEESMYDQYDLTVEEVVNSIKASPLGAKDKDIFNALYRETMVERDGQSLNERRYRDGETRFSLYILENATTKKVVSVRVEQPYGSDDKVFLDYQQPLIQGVTGIKDVNTLGEILSSNEYVALKAHELGFGQETVHYGTSYFVYSSNGEGRRVYEIKAVKEEALDYQPTTFFDGETLHYFFDTENYNRPRPYTEEDLVALLYDEFLNKEKVVSKEMLDAFSEEKQQEILELEKEYLGSIEPVAGEEAEETDAATTPPQEPKVPTKKAGETPQEQEATEPKEVPAA